MAKRVTTKKPRAEESELRDYELVVIFNPEITEEGLETALGKIHQFITDGGGIVADVEKWGKLKLAYPLKRFVEGNYVLTHFKLTARLIRQLEANLHISEEVLRHLLVKETGKA